METATRSVEFNFNNEMYQQKDGVAIGSRLDFALAKIFFGFHFISFVGFHLLSSCWFDYAGPKPGVYFRYVDDAFSKQKLSVIFF